MVDLNLYRQKAGAKTTVNQNSINAPTMPILGTVAPPSQQSVTSKFSKLDTQKLTGNYNAVKSKISESPYIEKIDSFSPYNVIKLLPYGIWSIIVFSFAFLIYPIFLIAIVVKMKKFRHLLIKDIPEKQQIKVHGKVSTIFLKERETFQFKVYFMLFLIPIWIFVGPINVLMFIVNCFRFVFGI